MADRQDRRRWRCYAERIDFLGKLIKVLVSRDTKLREVLFAAMLIVVASFCVRAQSRPPVILIPGLTGTELVNARTGQKVWFKVRRSHGDDLRLPITTNPIAARDALVPGDVIRDVKAGVLPRIDVYGGFISSLVVKGYREGRWDSPPARGYENTVYVFSYDWRRDNVENARLLIRRINALKAKLRRPALKFDIIGHSMGGLIARYAAMYGDADLPAGDVPAVPTWAGSKSISRLIIMGTPNEGSPLSLRDMVNGFPLMGIEVNLPFVQNLSKFDVFTIPSAYQLLPAPGTLRAYGEDLNPVEMDIYDPVTWSKYGWNPTEDKNFAKEFSPAEQRAAKPFFARMLDRAKRFHASLDGVSGKTPIPIDLIGAECKDTLDAVVLYQKKDGKWDAVFKADSFETPTGRKVTSEELKAKVYGPGDGVVTKRSLSAETLSQMDGGPVLAPDSTPFVCEGHSKLPSNPDVQAKIFAILSGK